MIYVLYVLHVQTLPNNWTNTPLTMRQAREDTGRIYPCLYINRSLMFNSLSMLHPLPKYLGGGGGEGGRGGIWLPFNSTMWKWGFLMTVSNRVPNLLAINFLWVSSNIVRTATPIYFPTLWKVCSVVQYSQTMNSLCTFCTSQNQAYSQITASFCHHLTLGQHFYISLA
jgi:hypothetical protein